MADRTHIEWTDATVNAINGCTVISPGCTNCYAMRLAGTRLRSHPSRQGLTVDTKTGPVWNDEVRLNEGHLLQPLRWAKPRRIFWNAHGDMFHTSVPDEWIDRCFAVMALTPQHIHQVLTKRSYRMQAYLAAPSWPERISQIVNAWPKGAIGTGNEFTADFNLCFGNFLPNVWLGVSVEDQRRANERIPNLLDTPAAVRWLSCEPLLGPIQIAEYLPNPLWNDLASWKAPELDWIVVGGESGRGARPMLADWARSLRDQCAVAGIPFFFKQWGAHLPCGQTAADGSVWTNGSNNTLLTTKAFAGRYLDGVEHSAMPVMEAVNG